jgi:hypothetical protein
MLPVVVAMVVLLLPPVAAQARLDLTGTWTMVPDRSESPDLTPATRSIVLNIRQSDNELNVDANRDGDASAVSYPIDKTAAPSAGTIGAGTTRAYWEGPRLVAWRAGNVQGQTVSIREVFDANADASEMTVETTIVIQHGYAMKGARNYASSKDVFTKAR